MMVHQPSAYALGARQDIACGNLGSAWSLRTSSDHVFYDIMLFRQDRPQSEGKPKASRASQNQVTAGRLVRAS